MNTFHSLWGVITPAEAKKIIEEQRKKAAAGEPRNLEEQALSLVGKDIYETLIKGYTEKQWGRECAELPAFIIKRIPVRFTFDNNYFDDPFQGIPMGGYNRLIDGLLEGIEVKTNTDFFDDRKKWESSADRIVYTGKIDEFYDYKFGKLDYRSLRFETESLDTDNYQGNAVINYTEKRIPFTRIIEHKHFEFGTQERTVITREYPSEWTGDAEAFYPINNGRNNSLYGRYRELAEAEQNVIIGGRLGEYAYHDMDKTIESALKTYRELNGRETGPGKRA
jgi:UDP-galactopyranose mutase